MNGQLYDKETMQPINKQNTNNMTLNELKHIIKESIKRQLNEISIGDKYKKEQGRTKWNADEFQLICQSDPTYNRDKDIVGKYTNWLLNKLQNIEQLQQVRIPLEWYADGMKRGILQRSGVSTDINKFKTINEFIETMNSVMHGGNDNQMSQSEYNNRKKLEGQFEIIGENADYEVIIPKTFAAERYFGSGTEWCTVANKNYFNSYTKKGDLYIFYPKNGDKELKMQFHIETDSYATYDDKVYNMPRKCISSLYSVNEDKINTTLELCQKVFKGKIPEVSMINITFDNAWVLLDKGYNPYDIFDSVYGFYNDYERVKLNGKYNLISNDNRLISPNQWYDYIGSFIDGYARVQLNNKRNFIDTNGNYLSDQWFDVCYSFSNGYANVQLNNKWNYIDTNGNYISVQWFDFAYSFSNGYACVELNNKSNFIDIYGDILSPEQWFDDVDNFSNGYACVELNNKYNWIDTNGKYLSEQWLDSCGNFCEGYAIVELNGKWNFIDTKGNILSEQWFDRVEDFSNGYASVKLNDKLYKINTDGQLYDKKTIQPINRQNSTNITLNELKHIIRESIKRKLNNL